VHLSDAAFKTLQTYRGKTVFVGKDLLTKNEYDQPRGDRVESTATLPIAKDWRRALDSLAAALRDASVVPAVVVRSESGKPGVQWQTAKTPDGLIVNLYNAMHDPMTVSISSKDDADMVDLLTAEHLPASTKITLAPMEVRLLRLPTLK
jgi:hypothetical protein